MRLRKSWWAVSVALVTAGCGGDAFTAIRAEGGQDAAPQEDAGPQEEASVDADAGASVEAGADVLEDTRQDAHDGCALVAHSNGYGGGWQSCEARGAYSVELAMAACASYFGADAGTVPCHTATCGSGVLVVEAENAACIAWAYGGSSAGFAAEGVNAGPCVCPTSAGMAWY